MTRAGRCIHFTGVQNKVCKVGLDYDAVRGDGLLPCLTMNGKRNDCCPQFAEPTAEQTAADVAETEAILARMRVVLAAVKPWRTWTKVNRVGKQEVIECPVCKGRLHLSQAAYNGHVHGQCETKGCVQWME